VASKAAGYRTSRSRLKHDGHAGTFRRDFDMAKKGRYGVMSRFKLKDGKVRQTRFWYQVR